MVENLRRDASAARQQWEDGRVLYRAPIELAPGRVELFQIAAEGAQLPPTARNDFAITPEDTPVVIAVLANDSDPNGDPLTVISTTTPWSGAEVVIRPDGTLLYTPRPDRAGFDSFRYTVSDGQGGTAEARVSVTAEQVDDPPRAVGDTAATDEDQGVLILPLGNDWDPENAPLALLFVGSPASGTAQILNGTSILYTPGADFFGSDHFTYTVSDGGLSAGAAIDVTIHPRPDTPIAVDDSAQTTAGTPVDIAVTANDIDPDRANPFDPTLTVTSLVAGFGGTPQILGSGVRFTPHEGFTGQAFFYYTVRNLSGLTDEGFVTVQITP